MTTAPSTPPFFPAPYTFPATIPTQINPNCSPAGPTQIHGHHCPPPFFPATHPYTYPPPAFSYAGTYSYTPPAPAYYPFPAAATFHYQPDLVSFPTSCYHPPIPNPPNLTTPPVQSASGRSRSSSPLPSATPSAAAVHDDLRSRAPPLCSNTTPDLASRPTRTRLYPIAGDSPRSGLLRGVVTGCRPEPPLDVLPAASGSAPAAHLRPERLPHDLFLDPSSSSTAAFGHPPRDCLQATVFDHTPKVNSPGAAASTPLDRLKLQQHKEEGSETEEEDNVTSRYDCAPEIDKTGSDYNFVTHQAVHQLQQHEREQTLIDTIQGQLAKLTAMASQLAVSIGKPAASASNTAFVAPQVFGEMPTPISEKEKHVTASDLCSGQHELIENSCVSNLSEQYLDELPHHYGFDNLSRRSVFRADGSEHSYFTLPADYPLERVPAPVFDVYADKTEDCPNVFVDVLADSLGHSNAFVDVLASNSVQQPYEEEQCESRQNPECFSKPTVNVDGIFNLANELNPDQVEGLNCMSLNTPWDPGVLVIHSGSARNSTMTTRDYQWLKFSSPTSCELPLPSSVQWSTFQVTSNSLNATFSVPMMKNAIQCPDQLVQQTSELSFLSLTACMKYIAPNSINSVLPDNSFTLQRATHLSQGKYLCSLYCKSMLKTKYCSMRCFWEISVSRMQWNPGIFTHMTQPIFAFAIMCYLTCNWRWKKVNAAALLVLAVPGSTCTPAAKHSRSQLLLQRHSCRFNSTAVCKSTATTLCMRVVLCSGKIAQEGRDAAVVSHIFKTQSPIDSLLCVYIWLHKHLIHLVPNEWELFNQQGVPGNYSAQHVLLFSQNCLQIWDIELATWLSLMTSASYVWDPGTMLPGYKTEWQSLLTEEKVMVGLIPEQCGFSFNAMHYCQIFEKCIAMSSQLYWHEYINFNGIALWLMHFQPP